MKTSIWEKHILLETVKVQLFFLFSLYAAFILIDFSTHSTKFFSTQTLPWVDLPLYYLHQFTKYLYLFLPLTLILATIKVLFSMNIHNELVALNMAGLSTPLLIRPFFYIAILCSCFCYANFEYFLPKSLQYIDSFRLTHSKKKGKKESLFVQILSDNTRLVYQSYLPDKQALFDVFWIHSPDEIWHMKYLDCLDSTPHGFFVDHFTRNKDNFLEKQDSFPSLSFTNMAISSPHFTPIPLENRSISSLFLQRLKNRYASQKEKAISLTYLHYKLAIPLLSLLAILAVTPFCVRFSRNTSPFFLYAFTLFGFVVLFTLMDACLILGQTQLLSPLLSIWVPFGICFLLASFTFYRKLKF